MLAFPVLLFCLQAPSGPGDEIYRITVENPERLPVRVFRHVEEDQEELLDLAGAEASLVLELKHGIYELRAGERGRESVRIPLPLPRRAQCPSAFTVRVGSARAAPRPDFVEIPPGPALFGDVLGVGAESERPAQVRDVPRFWIAAHEVTNREFGEFVQEIGPKEAEAYIRLGGAKCGVGWDAQAGRATVRNPDHPVVTVTWAGAMAYAAWRARTWGLPVALPSELEWEKAARGPLSWTYSYGNLYTRKHANVESGLLQPVGFHGRYGFGVADMTGNAFEWTREGFPDARQRGPDFGRLRGGSFVLDGIFSRNSMRMHQRVDVKADDFGLRLVILDSASEGAR